MHHHFWGKHHHFCPFTTLCNLPITIVYQPVSRLISKPLPVVVFYLAIIFFVPSGFWFGVVFNPLGLLSSCLWVGWWTKTTILDPTTTISQRTIRISVTKLLLIYQDSQSRMIKDVVYKPAWGRPRGAVLVRPALSSGPVLHSPLGLAGAFLPKRVVWDAVACVAGNQNFAF